MLRAALFVMFASFAGCLDTFSGPTVNSDGCPGVTYPDWATSPYVLPYRVGSTFRTGLSTCGGSFHSQGQPDEFAIDFDMGIGTLITASRPGTVVYVEQSGRDFDFPNNLVVVDHGDGTYGEYMHLTQGGALVDVGDTLAQGDSIGLSGATGLAGYPHLHFVVVGDDWQWPYVSVPVTFSNTTANPNSLRGGTAYEALSY